MRTPVNAATGVPVDPVVFDTALGAAVHTPVTFADVWWSGAPTGVRAPIDGGSLSWSRNDLHQVRGSARWLPDGDARLTPGAPGSLIVQGVTELRVWRGIVLPDGTDAVCSLGVFIVGSYTFDDDLSVTVELDARSQRVSRARLEQPVEWTAAVTVEEAVQTMLATAWPELEVQTSGTSGAAPAIIHETQTDPWQACVDAATSKGCWLTFDGAGTAVWAPEASLDETDPFHMVAGDRLTGLSVTGTLEGFHNRTFTPSSKPDLTAPVVGVATLTETTSLYRYGGPLGAVPQWVPSSMLSTVAEANTMAATVQAAEKVERKLQFTSWIDPRLELLDAVHVRRALMHVDDVAWVDEVSFDLAGDVMACSAGQQPQVVEG